MNSKDDLIKTTIELIREHGIAGSGIAEILTHSGRSRRTVYLNFPGGKAELVDIATQQAGQHIAEFIQLLATSATSKTELLHQLINSWKHHLVASEFRAGCPVVAAAMGRATAPAAADSAGLAFQSWITALTNILASDENAAVAKQKATVLVAAIEGALILSIATRSCDPLDDIEQGLSPLFVTKHPAPNHLY